jgi:DedD protein
VAQQTQDDGFHEIQLNGKQLVFLFMSATVISVVIFLCGVLVGRGAPYGRAAVADASAAGAVADTTPQQPATAAPTPAGSDPTTAAPPAPVDDLSYFKRLEKSNPTPEQLKPAPDRATAPAHAAAPPAAKAAATPAPAKAAAPTPPAKEAARVTTPPAVPVETAPPDVSGQGFAVQIAALNVRSEADAIARRLSSKGYAAYVLSPATGKPSVYRVRVGKFPTRREAEAIAAKLQKEEQLTPWVTR